MKAHYIYCGFYRNHPAAVYGRDDSNVTAGTWPSVANGFATLALLSPKAGGVFFVHPANHIAEERRTRALAR